MPFKPSFTVEPGEAPPFAIWQRLCAYVQGQTRNASKPSDFQLSLTKPRRSTKANNLCWACYKRIVEHYGRAGQVVTDTGLHAEYKEHLLPVVASAVREATGEDVEYEREVIRPDGRRTRTLTTTLLSPFAFSVFIELVDRQAAEVGCDLSEILDGEDVGSYKSGKVEDRGTDEIEYPLAPEASPPEPLSDEPFAHAAGAHADDPAGPLHPSLSYLDLY